MSETKKVAFSTLGPIKKDKKKVKDVKSLRIVLTLAESNEKSCPEFNYRELVSQKLHERLGKKNLGDVINGPSLDPTDPFAGDEDAALKALARKLENKYGGYTAGTKKKRRKESDFKTLGEGYDETDPFIDNSDAFDEVVPTHLETKHRGFYINSGELDFERVAAEEEEEEEWSEESAHSEKEVRRKKRLNQVQSDDEEKSEEEEVGEEEENPESEDEEGHNKKRKLHENGFIRHKKRKLDEGELLRKRKKMIGKFNAKNQEKKDSDQESEKPVGITESKACEVQPIEKSIKASIEAVVSKAREEAGEKRDESEESASSSSNSTSSDSDSSGSSSSSESESEDEVDGEGEEEGENEEVNEDEGEEPETPVFGDDHRASDNEDNNPLPDNLPSDLIQVITKLKEEGHSSKLSSQKFFTDSVNKLLLSIEMKLNKYGGRKKTQIYNHLSQHLPCGTQTIVKRAKNLLSERQESRLREPLKRLKEAVDAILPPLVEQHALECQRAAESKGENGVAQNDDESEDGDKRKSRLPKKKFTFTDEIRKLVCEVVRVRVTFWQMIKKRSETPENYIRTFLDTEVRPIWPKGWMNVRTLFKESHSAHACITDKNFVKPASTKKQHILGGGSVTPSITPPPPRPSLSATVIPKVQPSSTPKLPISSSSSKSPSCSSKPSLSSSTSTKLLLPPPSSSSVKLPSSSSSSCPSSGKVKEPLPKKKFITGETDAVKKPEDRHSTSVGLSIRSVEKINEGAPKTGANDLEKESEKESNSAIVSSENISINDKSVTDAKSKAESVSVIDLSSDDDKTLVSNVSSSDVTKDTFKSNDMRGRQLPEKDTSPVSSTTSVIQRANSTTVEGKKDDNLEEEMNSVMNEILQISKQKSVDDNSEKIVSKDNIEPSSVSSSTSKQQQASQSQELFPKNHQKHVLQSSVLTGKHLGTSQQKQQHHTSVDSHSSQNNHHSHISSPGDYTKYTSSGKPDRHKQEQQSAIQLQKQSSSQYHTSEQQKHLTNLHSPDKHERQTMQQSSAMQPNSPASTHHQPLSLSAHSYTQQSQQQKLSMQQSQPQQQPLNLQQTKSQQPLSYHQSKPHYQSPLPQQSPTPAEQPHPKKPSQQYPHQPSQQPKPVGMPSSPWSPGDLSVIPQTSPTGTNKMHSSSSWAPGHDLSPSKQQRQLETPIVSSSDPLANLRLMHGLSVSSVGKKTSTASTSVYHSPAALATSSVTSYTNPGSKKSSSGGSSTSIHSALAPGSSGLSSTHSYSSKALTSSTTLNSSSKVSAAVHSSYSTTSASSSTKHSSNTTKPRLDPFTGGFSQSMYAGLTPEQQQLLYEQLKQQQLQSNTLTAHQQQELWQQMRSAGFLSGMSGMSSTDMLKLITQMGKSMDSYSSASQPGQRHGQF